MLMGIDPGKDGLKSVALIKGKIERFYLKNKMTINPESVPIGDNYLIGYNKTDYLIGEGGKYRSLDSDKQSIQHKLCVYLAISQLAGNEPVYAVISCPYSTFNNKEKSESYINYIKENPIITISPQKIKTSINITEALPFAEGTGAAFAAPEKDFAGKVRGVLHIGGLDVNGSLFQNLQPIPGTQFTKKLGSIILINNIQSELNKTYPELNIQDYEVPQILEEGLYIDGQKNDKANKIIENVIGEHIEEIIAEAKKKNWSIKSLGITASGGGTLDISIKNIQKYIPQAKQSEDCIWDNALGNLEAAKIIFEDYIEEYSNEF